MALTLCACTQGQTAWTLATVEPVLSRLRCCVSPLCPCWLCCLHTAAGKRCSIHHATPPHSSTHAHAEAHAHAQSRTRPKTHAHPCTHVARTSVPRPCPCMLQGPMSACAARAAPGSGAGVQAGGQAATGRHLPGPVTGCKAHRQVGFCFSSSHLFLMPLLLLRSGKGAAAHPARHSSSSSRSSSCCCNNNSGSSWKQQPEQQWKQQQRQQQL